MSWWLAIESPRGWIDASPEDWVFGLVDWVDIPVACLEDGDAIDVWVKVALSSAVLVVFRPSP